MANKPHDGHINENDARMYYAGYNNSAEVCAQTLAIKYQFWNV